MSLYHQKIKNQALHEGDMAPHSRQVPTYHTIILNISTPESQTT